MQGPGHGDAGRTVAYTYDPLGRLSTALTNGSSGYPQWGLSWTYDRYGNRWAQTATAGSGLPQPNVTVDPATNHINSTGYAYDASGNATNDGFNTLVYDAENHAVSVSNMSASAAYTYDANGLRVKKAVTSGTTTVYIFSGSKVIAEYDNGAAVGSPSREYIYSGGTLLAKIESSATVYYHQDGLSARIMTDASGNVITQQGHYPYGELWYQSGTGTKWTFTTYERDAESTNDYAMARYYRNSLGRFNSPDPLNGSISDPQSLNRYSYSRNDPIDLMDPTGMDVEELATDSEKDTYSEMYVGDTTPEEASEITQMMLELIDEMMAEENDAIALEDATNVSVTVTTTPPLTDTQDMAEVDSDMSDFAPNPGLGGGVSLLDAAALKASLMKLFNALPDCAGLLGGKTQATNLVNQATILQTIDPLDTTKLTSNPATAANFAAVANGQIAGMNAYSTTSMLSTAAWNGGPYVIIFGPMTNEYSPSQMLTLTIHEMEHPATAGTGKDIDSQAAFDDIASKCNTEKIASGHGN